MKKVLSWFVALTLAVSAVIVIPGTAAAVTPGSCGVGLLGVNDRAGWSRSQENMSGVQARLNPNSIAKCLGSSDTDYGVYLNIAMVPFINSGGIVQIGARWCNKDFPGEAANCGGRPNEWRIIVALQNNYGLVSSHWIWDLGPASTSGREFRILKSSTNVSACTDSDDNGTWDKCLNIPLSHDGFGNWGSNWAAQAFMERFDHGDQSGTAGSPSKILNSKYRIKSDGSWWYPTGACTSNEGTGLTHSRCTFDGGAGDYNIWTE